MQTSTQSWSSEMKALPDKFEFDVLCAKFGITTIESLLDQYDDTGTYFEAYKYAKKEGKTDEEAEEEALTAESEERDAYFSKYIRAVMTVLEKGFKEHGLVLKEITSGKNQGKYLVTPQTTWEDAAAKIVETINGYGDFHYRSVKEFCNSGPYTLRQSVLSHLHWIGDAPAVYCDPSFARQVEQEMRY